MSHAGLFSRFLGDGRLHFAAHSHHPWPDVTFDAHQQAWLDAAELMDDKWERVLGEVMPEAQRHIAGRLALPDPTTIAFAPNTHELVTRLVSTLPPPVRILTTDGEFHSFRRQLARWEEGRRVAVTRVPVEPFDTFPYRFLAAARHREHDLTYVSHVFYDTGYVVPDLEGWARALPPDGHVVIDGYHGFMAVPDAARRHLAPGVLRRRRVQVRHGGGGSLLHALPARDRAATHRHRLVRRFRATRGDGRRGAVPGARRSFLGRHLRPERAVPVQRGATPPRPGGDRCRVHPPPCDGPAEAVPGLGSRATPRPRRAPSP